MDAGIPDNDYTFSIEDIEQLIEDINDKKYEAKLISHRYPADCYVDSFLDVPIWNLADVVIDGSPSELGRTAIRIEWLSPENVEINADGSISIFIGSGDICLLHKIE